MHFLLGGHAVLETIVVLAYPFIPKGQKINTVVIKNGYRSFLAKHQPEVQSNDSLGIEFVTNPKRVSQLCTLFDLKNETTGCDLNAIMELIKQAQARLSSLDETLGQSLSMSINTVFSTGSYSAGSNTTNTAIGAVCIDPHPQWSVNDIIEALIHENTHTLLFLDECRFGYYADYNALLQKRSFSAISGRLMPLHFAVHTIVIAAELLILREQLLGHPEKPQLHPPTSMLVKHSRSALQSLLSISRIEDLFTLRLRQIIEKASDYINAYNSY